MTRGSYRAEVNDARGKKQQDGVLAGHYKDRTLFRPALMAYPQTRLESWMRDDFPDLIWPAALVSAGGSEGLRQFAAFQRAVTDDPSRGDDDPAVVLDGRLSSIEATPSELRAKAVATLVPIMRELRLVPPEMIAALRLYRDVPGAWLVVEPWADVGSEVDPDTALQFLLQALLDVHDDHREALVKFIETTWLVQMGTFRASSELIDHFKMYPTIRSDWPRVDSMIRSTWSARKGAEYMNDPSLEARRLTWPMTFWRQNMELTSCLRKGDLETGDDDDVDPGQVQAADLLDVKIKTAQSEAMGSVLDTFNRFLNETSDGPAAADLWEPAKHEVVSGLITRAIRSLMAWLRSPDLWSEEHGAGIMRQLAETHIVLAWLDSQPASIYEKYKGYGTGKRKLMRRHMTDLVESFDEPPELLTASLEQQKEKLGGDWGEELINVSVASNFAKTTVRQMAAEVDLEEEYRLVYQPASGVTHGEWWAVEDHSMELCVNPLHRFHLIPTLAPPCSVVPDLARTLASKLDMIARLAVAQLSADAPDEG